MKKAGKPGWRLYKKCIGYAAKMRRRPTPAEAEISKWLCCGRADNIKFMPRFLRQHVIGRYIPDFLSDRRHVKIIVEVDGEYHNDAQVTVKDAVRQRYLKSRGYTVMRIRNDDVSNPEHRAEFLIRVLAEARRQGFRMKQSHGVEPKINDLAREWFRGGNINSLARLAWKILKTHAKNLRVQGLGH